MIYIQVLNRYWNPGKRMNPSNNTPEFHEYVAKEYCRLVKKAIDDQRYKDKWPSLTLRYLKSKISKGQSSHMWEATGELKGVLKVTRKNDIFIVGFPNRRHKRTRLTYVKLAKVLEFGSIRIPPRPLYRLVYLYMSANIRYFHDKFSKSVGRGIGK